MALTDTRKTPEMLVNYGGDILEIDVGVAVTVYQGALVCYKSSDGYAVAPSATTGLIAFGKALNTVVAGSGDSLKVKTGVFKFDNDSGDAVTSAHVGALCYVFDDHTVSSDSSGTSAAGKVMQVDSDGVWVHVNPVM